MYLQNWVDQARKHMRENRPTLYSDLQASGKLEAHLQDAATRTDQEMSELREMGYNEQEAWEIVRENYLFLPEEGSALTRRDSPLWKLSELMSPTEMMHAAIKSGARTIDVPDATITAADLKRAFRGDYD